MREIKFRFVDKGDGTVYKPITLLELCQRIEMPRRIVLESENGDFVGTEDFLDQFEKGELIVEQDTGLKDKNDKEICEGDIVGFKWTKRLYVVTYRRYDASFILENDEWEETIHLSLEKDDFEVFGNIHENHELLDDIRVTNKEEE